MNTDYLGKNDVTLSKLTLFGETEDREIPTVDSLGEMSLDQFMDVLNTRTQPLREMFADYRCAAMEIETKFKVLNERLSVNFDRNPIENIKVRIKRPESILRKLERRGFPFTVESIQENIHDVAGVRVVCSFLGDIAVIEKCFTEQSDIRVIKRKDYIRYPKPSGYRSVHLIVQVPIFTERGVKFVFVEVQLRTMAMEFWAVLDHKLRYKKDIDPRVLQELGKELEECAEMSDVLDRRMQNVRDRLAELYGEQ